MRLPRCLASVAFCDEIIVVDSGSSDQTMQVARAVGARTIEHAWHGFGKQRNIAIDAAQSEWILEIDADEWLSSDLQREIESFLLDPPAAVNLCVLPTRELFLGRFLGPASHYPYYRARMFRAGAYRHDETLTVHEGLTPDSRPAVFHGDLNHEFAGSLAEAVTDARAYARLEARQLESTAALGLVSGVLLRPITKFAYLAVLLGGWRDGAAGLLKITLQCAADSLTWLFAVRRGLRIANRSSEPYIHFGRRRVRRGPLRIVAVGQFDENARRLVRNATASGCWVTVITADGDGPLGVRPDRGPVDGWRLHRVKRLGILRLLQALDAEVQLGEWDVIVALDRRAYALLSLLPSAPRSGAPVVAARAAPALVEELTRSAVAAQRQGVSPAPGAPSAAAGSASR